MKILSFLFLLFLLIVTDFNPVFAGSKPGSVKILSYNVRNCRGMDEVTAYERVARIISRINADFVALQELDSVTERSKRTHVLGELARRTGMVATYRASINYQGGKYGIGFLTKRKPLKTEAIALPGTEEQRSLLLVEMDDMVVCCTHFSLTQADREKSIGLINQLVAKYRKPVFLAGDLNAEIRSPEMKSLVEKWEILNDVEAPTIPAEKPDRCIDYIAALKNPLFRIGVVSRKVESEPVASDHLPVWVEVKIEKNK